VRRGRSASTRRPGRTSGVPRRLAPIPPLTPSRCNVNITLCHVWFTFLALALFVQPAATAAQPPSGAKPWERITYGIEVLDEAGDPIDHPFLGGFNLPRPQLADADGDGDLDLFIQEHSDRIMFFRNESAGGASGYRWVTDAYEDLSVGEWYRFTDVDLDGDLDLLAEEPYSYIRYYRNDGGSGPADYVLATDTLRDVEGEAIFSELRDRGLLSLAQDPESDPQGAAGEGSQ